MPKENGLERKRPLFFKEPTDEDIEANGWVEANINARTHARIIGSRIMAATVAIGTGTAFTAMELFTSNDVKPIDLIPNFVIPAIINTIAEIKVERVLRHTARDNSELLQEILDANDNEDDNPS